MKLGAALALSALLASAPALADPTSPQVKNAGGSYASSVLGQEALQLVSANVAAAATPIIGGNYIFVQTCTAYGSVQLQVRGPDGTTFMTMATDITGGHAVQLGSGAVVQAAIAGTTGCNATLSRVP